VGLLQWALLWEEAIVPKTTKTPPLPNNFWLLLRDFARRLLP